MGIKANVKGHMSINYDDYLSFDHADIEGANFSDRKLKGFVSKQSQFTRCRFEKMKIEQACFGAGQRDSFYIECVFDGSRITAIAPGHARFERCTFRNVKLRGFFCRSVEFVDCVFSGEIRKAFFNGAVPQEDVAMLGRSRNEFSGNNFSGAELIDVGFRTGIDLTNQTLPSGPQYLFINDASLYISRAENEITAWKCSKTKDKSLAILKALELELEEGQNQLLLRSDGFSPGQREAAGTVMSILRALVDKPENKG